MATLTYPTYTMLRAIEQQLMPRMREGRLGLDILPIQTVDAYFISWEQQDSIFGVQQLRGLDGRPSRVKKEGGSRFVMEPGVYGEFEHLSERELTTAMRAWGTFDTRVDVSQQVTRIQLKLMHREWERIEQIIWLLLTTGTFSIAAPAGGLIHTDTYTQQTYNATTWSDLGNSTPLADLRAVQLLGRFRDLNFGAGARAYMNRATANNLLANTNGSDLGGRYTVAAGILPVINSIPDLNRFLLANDLPEIVVYDRGVPTAVGSGTLFIPNGTVVVVGQRLSGSRIGAYQMCRNANNPGFAAGPYTKVIDRGENEVPRTIEVHKGHTGGPLLEFPTAIVRMDVS